MKSHDLDMINLRLRKESPLSEIGVLVEDFILCENLVNVFSSSLSSITNLLMLLHILS